MTKHHRHSWMRDLWRPMMGWMYMLICFLDMAVFPVLWAFWQGWNHVQITQWNPLTLQGAGLFHIAMGAVLGISAFGRTQEKLAGTAVNPEAVTQTNNTNITGNQAGGFGSGNTINAGGGFGAAPGFGGFTAGGGFGNTPLGGNSTSVAPSTTVAAITPVTPPAAIAAPTLTQTPPATPTGAPSGPAQSFPPL